MLIFFNCNRTCFTCLIDHIHLINIYHHCKQLLIFIHKLLIENCILKYSIIDRRISKGYSNCIRKNYKFSLISCNYCTSRILDIIESLLGLIILKMNHSFLDIHVICKEYMITIIAV